MIVGSSKRTNNQSRCCKNVANNNSFKFNVSAKSGGYVWGLFGTYKSLPPSKAQRNEGAASQICGNVAIDQKPCTLVNPGVIAGEGRPKLTEIAEGNLRPGTLLGLYRPDIVVLVEQSVNIPPFLPSSMEVQDWGSIQTNVNHAPIFHVLETSRGPCRE